MPNLPFSSSTSHAEDGAAKGAKTGAKLAKPFGPVPAGVAAGVGGATVFAAGYARDQVETLCPFK
jgi:hypothetical protein